MTATWEERALSFDRIPEQYDRVRPGYPSLLYEDLMAATGIDESTPILEIGCGPGTFTQPLAVRGFQIDAVEPGPALARYAAKKLEPFNRVQVICSSFEAFSTERKYRLVVAAGAFHWLDVTTRFQHCAHLLEPGGFLAICGTGARRGPDSEAFWAVAQLIYRELAPELQTWHGASLSKRPGKYRIGESRLFDSFLHRFYPWKETYNASDFVQLLDTYFEHQSLPAETKAALYRRFIHLIETRSGGLAVQHYDSNLDIRRRKVGV